MAKLRSDPLAAPALADPLAARRLFGHNEGGHAHPTAPRNISLNLEGPSLFSTMRTKMRWTSAVAVALGRSEVGHGQGGGGVWPAAAHGLPPVATNYA